MDCRLFQNRYIIDVEKVRSKSYSGIINENGFPQIAVDYLWKMCNMNHSNGQVKMVPAESSALYKDVPQPIRKGGIIGEGNCRRFQRSTHLDTETRYHKLTTTMNGYLKIGDKIYDTEPEVKKCFDEMKYLVRLNVSKMP